ncbi:hypothetical protein OsJ_32307 [Oryza sativa Japonica Group]|uniref:C2 NT-type domain-containing protein n=1 Tax=Oryza sativa subsp. japonica TaxID=39947 RepID=A3C6X2_ORYSJ|nr:hypothetical protein OsJ_32307 [Oryza sativa Japonica Group]
MAGSGGEAMASSGLDLGEYLDRPDAIHRRAASVAIVRSGGGDGPRIVDGGRDDRRARSSRRLSLSSWRRPAGGETSVESRRYGFTAAAAAEVGGKTRAAAIWEWKPVRVLSRIGKRRCGCLLSVEVAGVRGVPASMDGLRLAVTVRKAETKDGAVQTMPATVRGGCADFVETLFVRCNIYFAGGAGTGKPLKLEPRRFVVSVVPAEAPGVRLGAHAVDVSSLVLDSLQKSSEGRRVRWFDTAVTLSGKATGGELLLKLGFQLMDDAGLCLYTQAATEKVDVVDDVSPALARAHNKNSFSVARTSGPKLSASDAAISPSMRAYKQLIDRLSVDEHGDPVTSLIPRKLADDELSGDVGLPEYEVVDKGVETVKEVVHYHAHRDVLKELDSIAEQIEAIEALMTNGGKKSPPSPKKVDQKQCLDADEEMVTVEFLRKLEVVDDKGRKLKQPMTPRSESEKKAAAAAPPVVPDLGPGLGTAVQTRDGGFLVSMNPFDLPLEKGDAPPKLAMQVSRPFVLPSSMAATGFDVLQKMAAAGGADEVRDKVARLGGMDNLTGKTPEQVGFEGIAEAVIGGRRTEGASSSAAPKLEAMAVDALMIQAEMADEDAPFEVAPAAGDATTVFDALVSPDEWSESRGSDGRVTVVAAIQLRDPSRRYEAVGAPMVAVVQSARLLGAAGNSGGRFKVRSLHVGGVQLRCPVGGGAGGGRASWGAERQKLTAMQWALAHGPARAAGRRARTPTTTTTPSSQARQRPDVVWSLSSRVLAGMWLKTVRNPDVRVGATAAGGGGGGN